MDKTWNKRNLYFSCSLSPQFCILLAGNLLFICSIGPKKLKRCVKKKWIHRKERLETWISRKKIVVAFILGDYSGLLLKCSFNSVLPRLLFFFFFFRYQTSSFCITLSHRALRPAYVEKVHLPLLGNDGGVVIVGLLILIISVGLLWQAGL